jgi:hypothetical protein
VAKLAARKLPIGNTETISTAAAMTLDCRIFRCLIADAFPFPEISLFSRGARPA